MQNHIFELKKKNTEKSMISKIKANVWGQIQPTICMHVGLGISIQCPLKITWT